MNTICIIRKRERVHPICEHYILPIYVRICTIINISKNSVYQLETKEIGRRQADISIYLHTTIVQQTRWVCLRSCFGSSLALHSKVREKNLSNQTILHYFKKD